MVSLYGSTQPASLADLASSLKPKSPWPAPRPQSKGNFTFEGDDDLYVMGPVGSKLLQLVDNDDYTKSVDEEVPETVVTVFGLDRRQRCEVRLPGSTSLACDCKRYEPRLTLPLALFNKLERHRDLQNCAQMLLDEMEVPEFWPGIRSGDFETDIEDHTVPGVKHPCAMGGTALRCASEQAEEKKRAEAKQQTLDCRQRGHFFLRYRLRREKRLFEAQRAGFRATAAMAVLDGIEYEANITLLPRLLRWCEEYRATKLALQAELAREDAEQKQEVAAKAGALSPDDTQQQSTSRAGRWTDSIRPPTAIQAAADAASAVYKNPLYQIPLPTLLCRCGHAMCWHARPPESVTRTPPPVESNSLPEFLDEVSSASSPPVRHETKTHKLKQAGVSTGIVGQLSLSPADTWRRLTPSASAPQLQKTGGWRAGDDVGRSVCASLDESGQLVLSETKFMGDEGSRPGTGYKELAWSSTAKRKPWKQIRSATVLLRSVQQPALPQSLDETQRGEAPGGPAEEVVPSKPVGKRLYRAPEEENVELRTARGLNGPRGRLVPLNLNSAVSPERRVESAQGARLRTETGTPTPGTSAGARIGTPPTMARPSIGGRTGTPPIGSRSSGSKSRSSHKRLA